ncbi:DUF1269 domain-containing protein [Hyphomicrobium sp. DY-1]|uniref:DUF1269 domain-containing protein n=1 Tax=Hyphomicrobium sp. DY-1 TaxID=3075650 RepID=UPI0039C46385
MSKFVAIIFSDEAKAYEGTRALKELHRDGDIVVYSEAVIAKDDKGLIVVKEAASGGPLGTAIGALTGSLIGLLAGPLGVAAGLAAGAFAGSFKDVYDMGVSADFVERVAGELTPGKTAIVAEIGEDWVTPLDTRISALGGVVIRTFRNDVEDEQIEREISATKAELANLHSAYKKATDQAKKDLEGRITEVEQRLEDALQRAKAKATALHDEAEAKVAALQEQAKAAAAKTKDTIVQRISEVREDYKRRSSKLAQAWNITKSALS